MALPAVAQNMGGGFPSLPAAAIDVRTGDLRRQLAAYDQNPLARGAQPDYVISPSIGVDVGVTDNARGTERNRQADIFTIISPAITVSAETARLRVNGTYSPTIYVYANQGDQTRIDQTGAVNALLQVVPGLVFLDVRGSVTQASRTGGQGGYNSTGSFNGNGSNPAQNRQDQVQSLTFSITPYVEQRFGGWGTARAGYSFLRTLQDTGSNSTNYNNFVGPTQFQQAFNTTNLATQGVTGNLTTQRERVSFVTGENLGRFNVTTSAEAVQYAGGGAYRGAYRNTVNADLGYAVTRTITAVAGAGYQDIKFSGTPGYRVQEPVWNVGVRLTPNADSTISVGFGRKDGANSLYLDAATAPTARTRLYARYSQGLSTDAEGQQDLLQSTTIGSTGLLQDSTTGAPVAATGAQFGTQNGLYRLRRFSVSGSLLLNRDTFSISLVNEDRSNISAVTFGPAVNGSVLPVLPAGSASNGTFGTLSWQHELTPVMTLSASGTYGITEFTNLGNSGGTRQTSISGQAALSYQFTETLSGSVRYLYQERNSNQAQTLFGTQGNTVQNTLLAGLRKSF